MDEMFERTARLIGCEAVKALKDKHVAVFGLGGVGGYAVEALVRGGVGAVTLVDADRIAVTNLNRQIIATRDTIGMKKTDVMQTRINAIRPDVLIRAVDLFVLPGNMNVIDLTCCDYILDAVDTVLAKLALAQTARETGLPLISVMGAGNKLDPCAFKVADICNTSVCPLARVMRRELKKRFGINHIKTVYSAEPPVKRLEAEREPGSVSFVPGVAGMIAAGEIIKDLINGQGIIPC
jgi:tRNA A37 threonylcarbamoyladenosine dehydratase